MASEEDFAGAADEDGVMAGGVEDAPAPEPPVNEQQQGGRRRSGRSTGSRRAARSSRREEPDTDGRVIYHDDPNISGDDSRRRRSWFSNLCRCCRSKDSDGLERTKSDVTYAGYAEADDDIYRKMCIGTLFAVIHLLLALLAVFATYSMIKDLITSMKNPVRSVHYRKVENYEAQGECRVVGSLSSSTKTAKTSESTKTTESTKADAHDNDYVDVKSDKDNTDKYD